MKLSVLQTNIYQVHNWLLYHFRYMLNTSQRSFADFDAIFKALHILQKKFERKLFCWKSMSFYWSKLCIFKHALKKYVSKYLCCLFPKVMYHRDWQTLRQKSKIEEQKMSKRAVDLSWQVMIIKFSTGNFHFLAHFFIFYLTGKWFSNQTENESC